MSGEEDRGFEVDEEAFEDAIDGTSCFDGDVFDNVAVGDADAGAAAAAEEKIGMLIEESA